MAIKYSKERTLLHLDVVEITSTQYCALKDPDFLGQSSMDEDGNYKMYSSSEGVNYVVNYNIYN
jgi:hypothetical protein